MEENLQIDLLFAFYGILQELFNIGLIIYIAFQWNQKGKTLLRFLIITPQASLRPEFPAGWVR